MGLIKLTESERLEILNLHNNARIIKEQVTPAVPAATTPAAAAPATVEDVIKQIQTTLNTKYGTKLTVDGKWGNLTQTAFETATKSKAAPAAATGTPAAATGTPAAATTTTTTRTPSTAVDAAPKAPLPSVMAPKVPGVSYQTTPATQVPATQVPATQAPVIDPGSTDFTDGGEQAPEVPAQSNRDQRRERQDLRRGNRRAMQDLRAGQRGQQQ